MSINSVFIGDLANADGNDVLAFDGATNHCTFPVLGVGSDFTVEVDIIPTEVTLDSFIFHPRAEMDYYLHILSGDLLMSSWSGVDNDVVLAVGLQAGIKYRIVCDVNGTSINAVVNGALVSGTLPVANVVTDTNMIGSQDGSAKGYTGEICCLKITTTTTIASYIATGDFGDATLVDHSDNGNDGTISGATWAKDKYQQSFATKELYKAQWIIPMEQSQAVTFELQAALEPQDSIYWNPYNQDGVFSFTVGLLIARINAGIANRIKLNLALSL